MSRLNPLIHPQSIYSSVGIIWILISGSFQPLIQSSAARAIIRPLNELISHRIDWLRRNYNGITENSLIIVGRKLIELERLNKLMS